MADSVSKLYAEIGFKINQDGLKQAQELLKSLAAQMTAINNATKNAAREYGIFSKDKAKQALADEKLATQKAKTERELNKKRIDEETFSHKKESWLRKENLNDRKRIAKEEEAVNRESLRNEQKTFKAREAIYKRLEWGKNRIKKTAGDLLKYGLGGTLGDAMSNALSSSVPIRDLLLQTGLSFGGTQNISRRFANIGIMKSQEAVLSDLKTIQQNIVDISFGAKGKTFPYKMLGAYAQKGNILGMVDEMGKLLKGLEAPDAVNLLGKMGWGEEWYSYFKLRERGGGLKNRLSERGQGNLVDAQTSLVQLRYAFQETAKMLTAELNPVITKTTDSLVSAFDAVIDEFKSNPEIAEAFDELGKYLVSFVKGIEWEKVPSIIEDAIKNFVAGIKLFNEIIKEVAGWLDIKTGETSTEGETTSKKKSFLQSLKNITTFKIRDTSQPQEEKRELTTMGKAIDGFIRGTNSAAPYNYTNAPVITINGVEQDNIANVADGVINSTSSGFNAERDRVFNFAPTFRNAEANAY